MLSFLFGQKKKDRATEKNTAEDASFLGSQFGSYAARHEAEASRVAVDGMDSLRSMADSLRNVGVEQKQGNLFEIIEATKFNMDAASKGADIRAYVTALEGDPHAKADIVIRSGGKILDEVQAKSSNDAARLTRMVSDEKYRGMQKLVSMEKADRVRELAENRANSGSIYSEDYRDTLRNVKGKLTYKELHSSGTSYEETIHATEHTAAYSSQLESEQFKKEIGVTSAQAAAASAVVGGAVSLIKNGIAVSKGQASLEQAAKNTLKETGAAGMRGASTGAISAGIRTAAQKAGIDALAKSNVATSIAAGVVDMGVTMLRYAKGEISSEQAVEKIGQTGVSTASSIYAGAAAGAVFGPVGAVVGSMAGYMIATGLYQSSLSILNEAKLAEEEAQRVMALCDAAASEMRSRRAEFEAAMKQKLQYNDREFKKCFQLIDSGLAADRFVDTIVALEGFAQVFGKELKLSHFGEFDSYMKQDKPLIL
ncbi:hypothetical protein [Brevibacillus choshinensis]|uniref:Tail tape measure protein n=1 Tax=Brevibacillus choshinensis TaxID=54911 RepID=A0ABX7FWP2_BRECH|nr:hypothetical protein [Brevibacillus choshinensis]QRG70272.1 hypothetical protein JNE38_14830 [Brevibacillus choshinensis]